MGFVTAISQRAQELRPGFAVLLQNPGNLIDNPRLRAALDGVARQDLLVGSREREAPNPPTEVAAGIAELTRARRHGLAVLVVEHVVDAGKAADIRRLLSDRGFLPYIAPRELDRLVPQD